mgnify:CR=1 FL=1
MSKPKDFTKLLVAQSERVKCVDLHPKEPLVLCSLFNGQVTLWNYETQSMLKAFEILDNPVRCCKFITRLQAFACGADDLQVRVFNYNTMEKLKTFEAHVDYIRAIAVHEQLPYMLTSSDDMTIKMWDWSKNWAHVMTFEGHSHYVMACVFNPKDSSTFATASLDHSLMVWSITSPVRNYVLEGHEKGVNCVEYNSTGGQPYLVSGSDDATVKIWDYQTKACLQTLTHHSNNVTAVFFHPELPLLLTAGEDDMFCTLSTQTWRLEQSFNYGMNRAWTISCRGKTNRVAVGYDNGLVVLRIGKEEPVMSMDSQGKILVTQNNDVLRMDVRHGLSDQKEIADGEQMSLVAKEVGTCEAAPQRLLHGPSGQFIAVLTEGEYSVNSALAWRPRSFGQAIAFAWGNESGTYAILENSTTLKTFKQFKVKDTKRLAAPADQLFSGSVLGVRDEGGVVFYDWESLQVVRRIHEHPREVVWSDSNELVALACDTCFVLKYNVVGVQQHFAAAGTTSDDGLDIAFDLVEEVDDKIKHVTWVGDCLVYVTQNDKLNYYIGGEINTITVLPRGYFFLGFVPKENRLFCIDKERSVVSYQLFVSVIECCTHLVAGNLDAAVEVLPRVPPSMCVKVAQFAQSRGYPKLALKITTDEDHRFELAILTAELETARLVAEKNPTMTKWKQLGDLALEQGDFRLAELALQKAEDHNGLLLMYTSTGNAAGIQHLGQSALAARKSNVAFTCARILGDHDRCIDILVATKKYAEAAFYARTYRHGRLDELVAKWKATLAHQPRIRDAIADPKSFPNLFPNVTAAAAAQESPTKEPTPSAGTPDRSLLTPDQAAPHAAGDSTPAMPPVPFTTPALRAAVPPSASPPATAGGLAGVAPVVTPGQGATHIAEEDDDWSRLEPPAAAAPSATVSSPTAVVTSTQEVDDIFDEE